MFFKFGMYWLYKNLFSFILSSNFYLKNFYLINYFNFFLIINCKVFFSKNSNLLTKLNNNNNLKNFFLNKYITYFNNLVSMQNNFIKKNQLNYLYSFKNYNFYSFNSYNFYYLKKFVSLLYNINKDGFNFIILDKFYKNDFPIYNYVFGLKNLFIYKKYFFINSYFFTYNNWSYYYNKFLKKFKIILIFILDFYYFKKFFKILKKTNLPLASLIPINNLNNELDYPIYLSTVNSMEKFVFLNILVSTSLLAINYKNYIFKINFLKKFYVFSLKFL